MARHGLLVASLAVAALTASSLVACSGPSGTRQRPTGTAQVTPPADASDFGLVGLYRAGRAAGRPPDGVALPARAGEQPLREQPGRHGRARRRHAVARSSSLLPNPRSTASTSTRPCPRRSRSTRRWRRGPRRSASPARRSPDSPRCAGCSSPVYRQLTLQSIAKGGFADPQAPGAGGRRRRLGVARLSEQRQPGPRRLLIGHSQGAGQLTR